MEIQTPEDYICKKVVNLPLYEEYSSIWKKLLKLPSICCDVDLINKVCVGDAYISFLNLMGELSDKTIMEFFDWNYMDLYEHIQDKEKNIDLMRRWMKFIIHSDIVDFEPTKTTLFEIYVEHISDHSKEIIERACRLYLSYYMKESENGEKIYTNTIYLQARMDHLIETNKKEYKFM